MSVRLLARSSSRLCVSPANLSRKFLAWRPSAHPFVIAIASASAELIDIVACVTLQCLSGLQIFSTPPEVEHLVLGHPPQPLATTTFNVFSVSTNGNRAHMLVHPGGLTCCRPPTVGFAASLITSFVANVASYLISLIKLAPSSTRATVSVVVRVQLFFSRCCCCCCCSFVAWCHHCLCLAHARRVQYTEYATLVQLTMPVQIDHSNGSRKRVSLSFIAVQP